MNELDLNKHEASPSNQGVLKLDRLKKIIDIEQGRKRSWVADQIEMKQTSFKQVLAGFNNLSKEKAKKLAKVLKVKLSEIWSD